MENPNFLKQKYDLHNSEEVKKAAERTEARTDESIPKNPADRIQNYLDRFNEILDREDSDKRERGVNALKRVLHDKFIIKPKVVPESTFLLEQRIAREQGYGDVEITEEFKEQKTSQIINNQTQSLDKWVDYIASPDAQYPDWAKYWAFRSMIEMGKLQKEQDESGKETARFQKRTKDTVSSFPPLNPRALALTIGALSSRLVEKERPKKERQPVKNQSVKLNDEEFQNLLSTENFSKIYAQFLIEMPEYSTEGLQEIRGEWVKYPQGSDPTTLVKSLEGYPLEWCTADYETAKSQLESGDFYVYYSFNESGEPIIPRLAIRMQDSQIGEDPRGIAPDQNLDPYIVPVLEEKLKEFGSEGDVYKKKSTDMKFLTALENKIKTHRQGSGQVEQELSKDDLIFLYEINAPIEGFGYARDPRIAELRALRNLEVDMPIVFDCTSGQIAHNVGEVSENTKAYVGQLEPGIFQELPENLEHIYTSFPEKKIRRETIEIGGKTAEQLLSELEQAGISISDNAKSMFKSSEFVPEKNREEATLIALTFADLGIKEFATTDQIYERAQTLGLELCPADTGPHYRLKYRDQPWGEWVFVSMKQIVNSDGEPCVFRLDGDGVGGDDNDGDGLWLSGSEANPDAKWSMIYEFVFRLRPPSSKTSEERSEFAS